MSHVERNERETLSRRQAAERLTDLAHPLAARPALTFDGRRITLPLSDELRMTGQMPRTSDRVELNPEGGVGNRDSLEL